MRFYSDPDGLPVLAVSNLKRQPWDEATDDRVSIC
jgi:hypothetical protein